jgi:predicted nucleotidyltransferase
MDKDAVREKIYEYCKKAASGFSVKEVILFGSWARGEAREDSDIDLAILLSEEPEDYLEAEKTLYSFRRNIDLRIEPVLLTKGVDPSGFSEMVQKTGIHVYP